MKKNMKGIMFVVFLIGLVLLAVYLETRESDSVTKTNTKTDRNVASDSTNTNSILPKASPTTSVNSETNKDHVLTNTTTQSSNQSTSINPNPEKIKAIAEASEKILNELKQNPQFKDIQLVPMNDTALSLSDDVSQIFLYKQIYEGFEVFNGDVRVVVNPKNGQILDTIASVSHINSAPDLNFQSSEKIINLAASALHINENQLSNEVNSGETKPMLLVQPNQSQLVYRLTYRSNDPNRMQVQNILVNAQSGQLVLRMNQVRQ